MIKANYMVLLKILCGNRWRWDGRVYTVPNGIFADGKYCIVFNKDVLGKKAVNFNGDILSVNQYLSKNKTDKDKLLFDLSLEDFAGILGGNIDYGMYFDGEKRNHINGI